MRARNIKPGFFTNEALGALEPATRLLFIGLWCAADREGRLEDRPLKIRATVFPYDAVDVDAMLNQLAGCGLIQRYATDDGAFIQIDNFAKHQNPHVREAPSTIPAPTKAVPRHNLGKCEASPRLPDSLIPDSLIPTNLEGTKNLGSKRSSSVDVRDTGGVCQNTQTPATATGPVDKSKTNSQVPYAQIVALWHEVLPDLPRCEKLTETRKGYIRQRWAEDLPDLNHWKNYFRHIARSDFLMGRANGSRDRPPFRATLEWVCRPSNYAKIAEDLYHGQE